MTAISLKHAIIAGTAPTWHHPNWSPIAIASQLLLLLLVMMIHCGQCETSTILSTEAASTMAAPTTTTARLVITVAHLSLVTLAKFVLITTLCGAFVALIVSFAVWCIALLSEVSLISYRAKMTVRSTVASGATAATSSKTDTVMISTTEVAA